MSGQRIKKTEREIGQLSGQLRPTPVKLTPGIADIAAQFPSFFRRQTLATLFPSFVMPPLPGRRAVAKALRLRLHPGGILLSAGWRAASTAIFASCLRWLRGQTKEEHQNRR